MSCLPQIDDAAKLYEDTESWTFEHYWNILHHEPKWNDKMIEIDTVGTDTVTPQVSVHLNTDHCTPFKLKRKIWEITSTTHPCMAMVCFGEGN